MDPRQLSGSAKAAILIKSMGEQSAAGLLSRLSAEERDMVKRHLQQVGSVSPDVVDQVAREFTLLAQRGKSGPAALPHFGGSAAEGASGKKIEGLEVLKSLDADEIYGLIKGEHPQTMAMVIIHLKTAVASEVVSQLPDEVKTDVAVRIAGMDKIIGAMVDEVNGIFTEILKNRKTSATSIGGGVDRLAEILNQADEISSELILSEIEEANPEMAAQIKQKMFVFEDIVKVDDRGFQKLLRRVESKELAIALKAASEEVKNKVFKNMSERAAGMLREEMDTLGPVRMKEVSDAQLAINSIVQELEAKGELMIGGRRGEQMVG
ncbi:MAG: flagellar motor switch protein FliG [Syntrophobacterales bacterium]|jgi:flagellar motor switch protein FliG|nr:MAG: flagellar motor switch protein FliG [Syntrophobacterales bacterium]